MTIGLLPALLALLAVSVLPHTAHAVVGGVEDSGLQARQSVMVLSSNGGVCSAVVVAPDVVMTAAHCVTGADQHRVHFKDRSGEPVLIVPAAKSVHPGFDARAVEKRTRSIDLALVRLPAPLPASFEAATFAAAHPTKGATASVSGYGLSREGDAKTTGTFRAADLAVIEPYGPSKIVLWLQGRGATGACQGDSGGPISVNGRVVAITSWSTGLKSARCGDLTQGMLVGAQRGWIDRILGTWKRTALWGDN